MFTTKPEVWDYTIWTSQPQKMRVLGWWQRLVHRLGGFLQELAYQHSPEVEVTPDEIQSTFTFSSPEVEFYES